MAKIGVSLKINVSMIEQARLFAGQKGHYLDATVFIDIDQLDQFGNSGMITQDVTKPEKDQGIKGPILGNCKVFWKDQQAPQPVQQAYQQAPQQAPQYAPQPVQQAPQQMAPPPPQGQPMGVQQAAPFDPNAPYDNSNPF